MAEPSRDDEILAIIRELVAHAAATDPKRRRFGARQHRYTWRPPLSSTRVEELERAIGAPLPADYRRFVTHLGDGGCGPYLGVLPLDDPRQVAAARGTFDPDARDARRGVIGVGHLGCGQLALLVVRGPAAGSIWADTRASDDRVTPLAPSFDAYVGEWLRALAHNEPPRALATPGTCAPPQVLSRYLAAYEQKEGLAPGTATAAQVAAALRTLPRESMAIASIGDELVFAQGDLIDPCPGCARLLEHFGLPQETLKPGKNPLAEGHSEAPGA